MIDTNIRYNKEQAKILWSKSPWSRIQFFYMQVKHSPHSHACLAVNSLLVQVQELSLLGNWLEHQIQLFEILEMDITSG